MSLEMTLAAISMVTDFKIIEHNSNDNDQLFWLHFCALKEKKHLKI